MCPLDQNICAYPRTITVNPTEISRITRVRLELLLDIYWEMKPSSSSSSSSLLSAKKTGPPKTKQPLSGLLSSSSSSSSSAKKTVSAKTKQLSLTSSTEDQIPPASSVVLAITSSYACASEAEIVVLDLWKTVKTHVTHILGNIDQIDSLQFDIRAHRRQAFDEIVMKYPYPELRVKDSNELLQLCLFTKSNIQMFDQEKLLEAFLIKYVSQSDTAANLPGLNRTAESFLRGVPTASFENASEIQLLLKNKNEEFKKRSKRLRVDVLAWICDIKKALRQRKQIWDDMAQASPSSATASPSVPELDNAQKQLMLNELETRESSLDDEDLTSSEEIPDLYPKADAKVYTDEVRTRLSTLPISFTHLLSFIRSLNYLCFFVIRSNIQGHICMMKIIMAKCIPQRIS